MAPSATTSRADLRRLAGELVGSPGRFVGICVSGVLSATIEAALLVIVVEVAVGLSETGRRVSFDVPITEWTMSIGPILTLAIALATAKIAAGWWGARLTAAMSTDVLVRLRTELYDAFAHASWSRQSTERLGTLQELLGGHCRQASAAVRFGAAAIFSAVNFAILVVVAILVEPTAALLILAAVVLLYLLLRPLTRAAYNAAKASSDSQVAYANLTVELSDLAEEVTVFGVGGTAASAVEAELERTAAPHYRSELMARLLPELYTSTSLLVIVGALAIVAAIDGAGLTSLGVVVVLLVRALTRAQGTQNSWHRLIEFLPYTDRVLVHRDELRAARETTAGRPLDRLEAFGLDHVSFAYDDEGVVLDDVSMEVRRGEALGIIGPSGGGKTTLVELLLRLRTPTSGRVLVNGEDAPTWDRADFNHCVGFVPQEPRLITASIADNIRFFRPDITDESIARAASLARLDDEIEVLEAGYDTVVSERGRGLSGGQRQRLCLARALAGDPQVLVLDEPTSALDARSEELLRASLSTLIGGLTVVLVAHRPATLAICERVLVLTDGRVEALAPVAELAEVNAFYRDATARS